MSEARALMALGQTIAQAAREGDWATVQRVDLQLADALFALRGRAHGAEMRQCAAQRDALAEKMALSLRNREGAAAYATFADDRTAG
ncbi:hypothetical protein RJ498_003515 [Pluralibacter gergoviae]